MLCRILVLSVLVVGVMRAGDGPAVRYVRAFPGLGFAKPVQLVAAGDGSRRLHVVEQAGRVLAFPHQDDAGEARVFIDLRERVWMGRGGYSELGLLALAFHPRFAENRQFFVWYSRKDPLRTVLSRFTAMAGAPDQGDPASEQVLIEVRQPFDNHNGGAIVFGGDGFLYLSIGDGGSAGDPQDNGQKLSTLLGKIIRIDVDRPGEGAPYAIPADNPFVGRTGARPEIWAYGLRNVWRMNFDRVTGTLWAGEVGQNAFEEVDVIVKGGNYGWRPREGKAAFRKGEKTADMIDPVIDYPHALGRSITGGFVYRGKRVPGLIGAYVYGDYASSRVWAATVADGTVTGTRELPKAPCAISSFGEDADGELYIVGHNDGKLYRIE